SGSSDGRERDGDVRAPPTGERADVVPRQRARTERIGREAGGDEAELVGREIVRHRNVGEGDAAAVDDLQVELNRLADAGLTVTRRKQRLVHRDRRSGGRGENSGGGRGVGGRERRAGGGDGEGRAFG